MEIRTEDDVKRQTKDMEEGRVLGGKRERKRREMLIFEYELSIQTRRLP